MHKIATFIMSLVGVVWMPAFYIRWCAKKAVEHAVALSPENVEFTQITRPDFHWLDFPWLDWTFYQAIAEQMSEDGFRHIGDVENPTLNKRMPAMKTYVKCFLGDSGTITASAFHMKKHGWGMFAVNAGLTPKSIQAIEFGTEFDDHTFLATHNLAGLDESPACPEITTQQFEPGTPYEDLLHHHRERLQSIVEERHVQPVHHDTIEDYLATQHRLQAIQGAQRRRISFMPRDQLEAMFDGKHPRAQRIFTDEFERISRDYRSS